MRLLALPMESEPAGTRGLAIDEARRTRFLRAARPALDRAYRLAGVLLGNASEAEDAVQDALATAWQAFDSLREADRFVGWFDRILANDCRDRLRRRGVVRFIPIEGGGEPVAVDPFQELIERDAALAGLAHLTPDERIVVVLRFWADLPLDAIAEHLDWPLGTVKSRLHRALMRLRERLETEAREMGR